MKKQSWPQRSEVDIRGWAHQAPSGVPSATAASGRADEPREVCANSTVADSTGTGCEPRGRKPSAVAVPVAEHFDGHSDVHSSADGSGEHSDEHVDEHSNDTSNGDAAWLLEVAQLSTLDCLRLARESLFEGGDANVADAAAVLEIVIQRVECDAT